MNDQERSIRGDTFETLMIINGLYPTDIVHLVCFNKVTSRIM